MTEPWTDIISVINRQDLTYLMPNFTEAVTTEMPTTVEATTVATTTAADVTGTTGATVTTTSPADMYSSYISQLQGRCPNIPAGIHVEVLYSEAGKANYVPIYNIIGAKIR